MSKVKIVSYRKHTPADASCFTCAEGSLYRVRSFGVQCSNVGKWHCANTTTLICRSLIFLIFQCSDSWSTRVTRGLWRMLKPSLEWPHKLNALNAQRKLCLVPAPAGPLVDFSLRWTPGMPMERERDEREREREITQVLWALWPYMALL